MTLFESPLHLRATALAVALSGLAGCMGTIGEGSTPIEDEPAATEPTGEEPTAPLPPGSEPPGEDAGSQEPTPVPADTQPPTAPGMLRAVASSATEVSLTWQAATDDTGVTQYRVLRDGAVAATLAGMQTTYVDSGRSPGTAYSYVVYAVDGAQNPGPHSNMANVTTPSLAPTWPDASSTGVPSGTALTASGSIVATQNGQVIDAKDVTGSITVRANNVTIKRTRITPTSTAISLQQGFGSLLVEDVTIVGPAKDMLLTGLALDGTVTLRRVNLSGYTKGVLLTEGGGLIEDSYFHHLSMPSGRGQDAIEVWQSSHLIIRHNHLDMNTTDANSVVKLPTDVPWPGGDDVLIENNLLVGGGYTVIGGDLPNDPQRTWTNVRVVNNHFSTRLGPKCGYWGPITSVQRSLTTGNVWHESGAPLNP